MLESHGHIRLHGVALEEPDQGRKQTQIAKDRRSEIEGEITKADDEIAHERLGLVGQKLLVIGEHQIDTGQALADLVVEFAGERSALGLLRLQQLVRQALQLRKLARPFSFCLKSRTGIAANNVHISTKIAGMSGPELRRCSDGQAKP